MTGVPYSARQHEVTRHAFVQKARNKIAKKGGTAKVFVKLKQRGQASPLRAGQLALVIMLNFGILSAKASITD
jgi:hypothetical protein